MNIKKKLKLDCFVSVMQYISQTTVHLNYDECAVAPSSWNQPLINLIIWRLIINLHIY